MTKYAVYETVWAKIGDVIEPLREAVKEASRIQKEYPWGRPIYMPLSIAEASIGVCFEVPKTFMTTPNRWIADYATLILEHPAGVLALVYIYPEVKPSNPLFDILWELSLQMGEDLTSHCMPIWGLNGWELISRDRIASLCREQIGETTEP